VVEGARLESVYRGDSIEGSNPFLSATSLFAIPERLLAALLLFRVEGFIKKMPSDSEGSIIPRGQIYLPNA